MFKGLFDSASATTISVENFLLCVGVALVIGLFLTLCYGFRSRSSKSFTATIAILPTIVCVVIMMVNGNIGAGVAVYGVLVIALRILRAEDVRSIPKGEKIIKLLHLK